MWGLDRARGESLAASCARVWRHRISRRIIAAAAVVVPLPTAVAAAAFRGHALAPLVTPIWPSAVQQQCLHILD